MKAVRAAVVAAVAALVAWATPASASFNFSNCGNFEFIALQSIEVPESFGNISGDILVLNPTGVFRTGQKNTFTGTVAAATINVGTNSTIAVCRANVITGPGTCLVEITPFSAPAGCLAQPFPPGFVTPAVPAVCLPGTAVLVSTNQTLPAGCYQSIRVGKGVTLTLETGPGVDYITKGEFRTLLGGTVQSDTPGVRATIVAGTIAITESNVTWRDLFVFQLATSAMHIFNGSKLINTVALAPFGSIHPHTGGLLTNSALAAVTLTVEPIVTVNDAPPPVVCECPPGFTFRLTTCAENVSCAAARECVPD